MQKFIKRTFTIISLLFTNLYPTHFVHAADYFTSGNQVKVHTSNWQSFMHDELQDIYCKDDGYLKNCYQLSESDCLNKFEKSFKPCFQKNFQTQKTTQPFQNRGIASNYFLGTCIANAFDNSYSKQKAKECALK